MTEHNSDCDVTWVDGKPYFRRSIGADDICRICFPCMEKIELQRKIEPMEPKKVAAALTALINHYLTKK